MEFESGTSPRNNYDLFDKGELGNSTRTNRRCVKMNSPAYCVKMNSPAYCVKMNSPAYSFTSISFVTNTSTGVIK